MLDTSMEKPRQRPRLGRAALIALLAMWALFLFFMFSGGLIDRGFADAATPVFGVGSYVVGAGLAVASLIRRERKRPAVITLCLLVGGPVLFFVLAILVWFGYGLGLS